MLTLLTPIHTFIGLSSAQGQGRGRVGSGRVGGFFLLKIKFEKTRQLWDRLFFETHLWKLRVKYLYRVLRLRRGMPKETRTNRAIRSSDACVEVSHTWVALKHALRYFTERSVALMHPLGHLPTALTYPLIGLTDHSHVSVDISLVGRSKVSVETSRRTHYRIC